MGRAEINETRTLCEGMRMWRPEIWSWILGGEIKGLNWVWMDRLWKDFALQGISKR